MLNLFIPAMRVMFSSPHFYYFSLLFIFCPLSTMQAQDGSSFRTETQEKWGAVPKGNNSAAYMYRKFEAAFPNGITVGCTNKLVFSNPYAITELYQYYLLVLILILKLHSAMPSQVISLL
jgi:hypothetical protein